MDYNHLVSKAVCKLCQKSVYGKGGCTTNLLSHLKVHNRFNLQKVLQRQEFFIATETNFHNNKPR